MKKILSFLVALVLVVTVNAQNFKYGKVSKAELEEQIYPLDSSANAAFLYKFRSTLFKYVQGQGFLVITSIHERIKIYNQDGYDWATKRIRFYKPDKGSRENIIGLEARTYVLENGKVEDYKLKKNNIFTEKDNKYWSSQKFTLPNISDGCVIEYKYKISSPYNGIDKVELQHTIPVKKIDYTIAVPEYYNYNIKQLGYLPINAQKSSKNSRINFSSKTRSSDRYASTTTSYSNHAVDYLTHITEINNTNVPAIIEEDFVDNINNYKSAILYELTSIQWPNQMPEVFSQTWKDVAETIYKRGSFGGELSRSSYFKDDLEQILSKTATKDERIVAIFEFVKSKIKWNEYNGVSCDAGVRKAYKEGVGNVADINLTLTAMLIKAGVEAYPLILSTRSHGVPNFPTIDGLNYVISAVKIGESYIYLDATEQYAKPNILPERAINWQGIVVGENGFYEVVPLTNLPKAKINSTLTVKLDNEGGMKGMNRTQYSNYYGMTYRGAYNALSEDELVSKFEDRLGEVEIGNIRINNKENYYKPVVEMFTFNSEDLISSVGNKMYIKPLLFNVISKNKFKLENREYPVDFTTTSSRRYATSIEIPEGYTVESLPEQLAIGLPNKMGVYKFTVTQQGNKINTLCELSINTVVYPAQYYKELKEFYKQIVKKNAEQVVLKKV